MPCAIHPGVASTVVLFNRSYCARCQRDIQAAVAQLDNHVTPRDCFVWYKGSHDGWAPITGTGCAHYVAHQLGIQAGPPGALCLAGYVYRVPMVIIGRQRITGGWARYKSTTSGSARLGIIRGSSRESTLHLRSPPGRHPRHRSFGSRTHRAGSIGWPPIALTPTFTARATSSADGP